MSITFGESIICCTTQYGKSLRPIVDGKKTSVNDFAFIQWEKGMSISDGRFIYTSWYGKDGQRTAEMLFDHKKDPDENVNISAEPSSARQVRRLSKVLDSFRIRIKGK